jgi:hypothetical protein
VKSILQEYEVPKHKLIVQTQDSASVMSRANKRRVLVRTFCALTCSSTEPNYAETMFNDSKNSKYFEGIYPDFRRFFNLT